jgi:hypothetical protein
MMPSFRGLGSLDLRRLVAVVEAATGGKQR